MKDRIERIATYAKAINYNNDCDAEKLGGAIRAFSRLIRENREQVKMPEIRKKILEFEIQVNGWLMEFFKDKERQDVNYDRAKEFFLLAIETLKPHFDMDYDEMIMRQRILHSKKSSSKLPNPQNVFLGREKTGTISHDIHVPTVNEKLCLLKHGENLPFTLSVSIDSLYEMLEEMEMDISLQYNNLLKRIILEAKRLIAEGGVDINLQAIVEQCCLKFWEEELKMVAGKLEKHDGAFSVNHEYSKFMGRLLSHFCTEGKIVLYDKRTEEYAAQIEFTSEKTIGYFHYEKYNIVRAYTFVT